ncbi:MAG TPA: hypothetical protein VFE65_08455 [Pseudonocardia sp.]|jgi:hypothetical protein|nr:hypothetical protein [Pseudonocardia sp.]
MRRTSRQIVAVVASVVLGAIALQGAALAQGAPPVGAGPTDGQGLVGAKVSPLDKLTGNIPAVGGPSAGG